jgi:hypothetical protein
MVRRGPDAMTKTYIGIDQYGSRYPLRGDHPRKALLDYFNRKSASRMFTDKTDGGAVHIGWIVAGLWITVYERMEGAA